MSYIAGPVTCRICRRTWVAVVYLPPGLEDLECPDCGNKTGDETDAEEEAGTGG